MLVRLQLIFFTFALTLSPGQVLSVPPIQCPDCQQYIVDKAGGALRFFSLKNLCEIAFANGGVLQAQARLHNSRSFAPTQRERIDPYRQPKNFWSNTKLGAQREIVGETAIISRCRYTVVKGDTFGKIAEKILGSAKRWKEIARANELSGLSPLSPGQVLQLPCAIAGKGAVQAVAPLPLWSSRPGEYVADTVKGWSKSASYIYQQVSADEWELTLFSTPSALLYEGAVKELIVESGRSEHPLQIDTIPTEFCASEGPSDEHFHNIINGRFRDDWACQLDDLLRSDKGPVGSQAGQARSHIHQKKTAGWVGKHKKELDRNAKNVLKTYIWRGALVTHQGAA